MFQRFNKDTIESKFIKALLSKNYTPTIEAYSNNSYTGNLYLDKDKLVNSANTVIKILELDKQQNGINTTFRSNAIGYDSNTHKQLGNYLRYYRDTYGIDLMPLYNCYSNIYLKDIYYNGSKLIVAKNIDQYPKDFKLVAIPIKFNKEYTIAIDCSVPYYIYPVLYGNKGIISVNDPNNINNFNPTYTNIAGSRFNNPYLFEGIASNEKIEQYSNYLYLVLQLPISNKSSIVVLEGNYIDNNYINNPIKVEQPLILTPEGEIIVEANAEFEYKGLTSKLSLLKFSDGNCYAFSDRLIEYLLLNVIDSKDDINKNVERVIKFATSDKNADENDVPKFTPTHTGYYWDEDLRKYIYNLMLTTKHLSEKYDILGYVDKDAETILSRGQG